MASGKLLLRISELRHRLLQQDATALGISVNELCRVRVRCPSPLESLPPEVGRVVQSAENFLGEELVGIALFGSAARGDESDQSDIDILVILDPSTKINRTLYRKWEEQTPDVGKCEPHFVRLPNPADRISGLWAEVAIDGLILWERGIAVHSLFVKIRRAIIEGQLVSKKIHGQTYWVQSGVA